MTIYTSILNGKMSWLCFLF